MANKVKQAAAMPGGIRINSYFPPELVEEIDEWRRSPERPIIYPRAAALRELTAIGLAASKKGQKR